MEMARRLLETEFNMSNSNNSRDSYVNDMVVILAALLCALICALGLNSIVRCALRCGHRFISDTPEQTAARLAATGLKKKELGKITVAVYGDGVGILATECPICLGEFVDGEKVRVLPKCNHGFHVRCIDTWLLAHSSCPNCRHSLLDKTPMVKQNVGLRLVDSGSNPSDGTVEIRPLDNGNIESDETVELRSVDNGSNKLNGNASNHFDGNMEFRWMNNESGVSNENIQLRGLNNGNNRTDKTMALEQLHNENSKLNINDRLDTVKSEASNIDGNYRPNETFELRP